MLNKFIFLTIGFAAPLLLWSISQFLPYPHVVEELFKFFSLLWISSAEYKTKPILTNKGILLGTLFGLLFTVSESVFYLMNLSMLNQFYLFPRRLIFTGVLHVTTTLILLTGIKKSWLVKITTLLVAVGLHYIYNAQIASF